MHNPVDDNINDTVAMYRPEFSTPGTVRHIAVKWRANVVNTSSSCVRLASQTELELTHWRMLSCYRVAK